MAEKTVEELRVLITANTKDFKTKIQDINKKLKSIEAQAKKAGAGVESGTSRMSKAFTTIKVAAAVKAIQSVTQAVKKLTDAYAETESAQMGLSSILTAQGKDVGAAKAWLKDYTKDGLIPLTEAYTAYKNLASAGYSDEQTQSILQNLKDAAAFGRQSSMTMGEAVKSATEGIKNENSVLVDNAGVSKNLSVIWEEYANSVGKSVSALTEEEKRLATVQGLMRETAYQTGNAAQYATTYAGAQAALKAQTKSLASALGSVFAPALQAITPHITNLVARMTELAERAGQVMAIIFGTTTKASTATQQLAASTQTVSSGLSDATKQAKAYKAQLLGIDEINRLGSPDTDSGGSGGSATTTTNGGNNYKSPLSDADSVIDPKIAARAEELKKKLEKVKKAFSALSPVTKGVAAGGAAALGVKVLSKWYAGAKSVWNSFKGLNIISSFLDGFSLIKASGGTTTQSLSGGFKNATITAKNSLTTFRASLSKTQKAMIGAAGFTASLVMAKSAFKDLAMGTEDAKIKLALVVPAVAATGTAMYAALGPIGLVVTAVGTLTGAVWGYIEAVDEQAQAIYESSASYAVLSEVSANLDAISQRTQENMSSLNSKVQELNAVSGQYIGVRTLVDEIYALSDKTNKSVAEIEQMRMKVDLLNSMNIEGLELSFDETTGAMVQAKDSVYELIEALEAQSEMVILQDILTQAYKTYGQAIADNILATENCRIAEENLAKAKADLKKKEDELGVSSKNTGLFWADLFNKLRRDLNPEYRSLKKAVSDAADAQAKAKKKIEETNAATENATKTILTYTDRIEDLRAKIAELKSKTVTVTANVQYQTQGSPTQGYASGGYPEKGQLFIAREAGPEMVGTIGGKTAVANNNQIVEGITAGVTKGVYEAMQGYDGGTMTIIIQNEDGDVIQKIERANMRAGKVMVAVDR